MNNTFSKTVTTVFSVLLISSVLSFEKPKLFPNNPEDITVEVPIYDLLNDELETEIYVD